MPALLTHYLCGFEVIRQIEGHDFANLLTADRQVFNLGAQGPDFLFYHRAWPWTKGCGLNKAGERLHEESTGKFFRTAFSYASELPAKEAKQLFAYLSGYLCHYSLDLHAHPYIFYRSGFVRTGEHETQAFSAYHRRLETAIDVLMLDRILGLKPKGLRHAKLIAVNRAEAQVIGRLYSRIFAEVYGLNIHALQAAEAVMDMTGIVSFLQDDTGMKKKLIGWIEGKQNVSPLISSLIHPQSVETGPDYLNLSHSCWYMPWDDRCGCTASFPDLFEAAVNKAVDMCLALHRYMMGEDSLEEMCSTVGNLSFSSGLDCDAAAVFSHYHCIF